MAQSLAKALGGHNISGGFRSMPKNPDTIAFLDRPPGAGFLARLAKSITPKSDAFTCDVAIAPR